MAPVKNLEFPRLDSVLVSLGDYVAIPSDSRNADPDTMRRAADWIAGQLDFASGRVEETGGHPVVRGEWLGAPGAPTFDSSVAKSDGQLVVSWSPPSNTNGWDLDGYDVTTTGSDGKTIPVVSVDDVTTARLLVREFVLFSAHHPQVHRIVTHSAGVGSLSRWALW